MVPFGDYVFSLHMASVSVSKGSIPRLCPYPFVCIFLSTPKILFGVNNQSISARETLLEQGITRGQGHSIVATLENKIYGGEHGLHLIETSSVMAQEVGPREEIEGRKDMARDEGCHCELVLSLDSSGSIAHICSPRQLGAFQAMSQIQTNGSSGTN